MSRYGVIGVVLMGVLAFASGAGAGTINIFGDTITITSDTDITHTGTNYAYWTWQPAAGANQNQGTVGKNWGGTYPLPQYMSGSLAFDVIALYAKPTKSQLEFAVVISLDPGGYLWNEPDPDSYLGTGDLRLKFSTEEYGIGLRPTRVGVNPSPGWGGTRPAVSINTVRKAPTFHRYDGIENKIDDLNEWTMDPTTGDPANGSASVSWTPYTGGGTSVRHIWVATGTWSGWGWSGGGTLYYGLDCNNDRMKVQLPSAPLEWPIPESSTLALFGLGVLGLLFRRRK